jgi:hypothetical protein
MPMQAILFYTKIFIYFYIKPKHFGAVFCRAGDSVLDAPAIWCHKAEVNSLN